MYKEDERAETHSVPPDNQLVVIKTLGGDQLAIFSSKQNRWIVLEEVYQEFAIIDWKPLELKDRDRPTEDTGIRLLERCLSALNSLPNADIIHGSSYGLARTVELYLESRRTNDNR